MKTITKFIGIATLLSACASPSVEDRIENRQAEVALTSEVAAGMANAAPAAVSACISQVESGSFSESDLTTAGFRRGNALITTGYTADVSKPFNFGVVERPLRLGLNIGASGASLGVSGCKISLPLKGEPVPAFLGYAARAFSAQGYTFQMTGRGRYLAVKGGSEISMKIQRLIQNGSSFLSVSILSN